MQLLREYKSSLYSLILNLIFTFVSNSKKEPEPNPIRFRYKEPDTNFTGRSDELLCLENATINHQNQQKSPIIVVCGLGGIGKTQLVRKFIERNQSYYKNVIWINAQERSSMEDEFKILARNSLHISTKVEDKEKDFNSLIEEVFIKLSTSQTVIVFDNVDETKNTEIFKIVLTIGTSGIRPHIVVTSRIQEWSDSFRQIKLGVFSPEDALEYVSTKLGDLENVVHSLKDKMALVELLQRFPLALRQATAHINHHRVVGKFRIDDYMREYTSFRKEILDSKHFKNDDLNLYEETTLTTWIVTLGAISKCGTTGDLALRILRIIAYFHPDHIRRDIFFNLNFPLSETKKGVETEVTEAVRLLVNYSMVDSHTFQSVLSIHRLVQQVIRIELVSCTGSIETILRDGIQLLSEMTKHEDFKDCYEHGISVFLQSITFDELVREFETFPMITLQRLNDYGKYNRAINFWDEIKQPFATILGDDNQVAINSKFFIGQSLIHLGRYSESLEISQEILEKQKKILGEDHPDTLKIKSNIAVSYVYLGKFSDSLERFKEIFEKRKITLGEDDRKTLGSQFNIANMHNRLGNYNEALRISREVFEKQRNIFGEDDPVTIKSKSIVAESYHYLGKYSEALRLHQEVFEKRKTILGEDHPMTLTSKFRVAHSYRNMGNYSEAHRIHEEVFEKRKLILGEDHTRTLKSMSQIADRCNYLGKYSEALQMHQHIYEKRKTILGEDHPYTLRSKSKIADSYNNLGEDSKALTMHQEIFEKRKTILAKDHPETLDSNFNVAVSYSRLGEYLQALQLHQEVFQKRHTVLGENHPDTLTSKFRIADTYKLMGNHSAALQMFEEVYEKRKTILGEDHPDTLNSKLLIGSCNNVLAARSQNTITIISKVLIHQVAQTFFGSLGQ